jgi:hypothetical protein
VKHPDLTLGLLALTLFAVLGSSAVEFRLYNSIVVACTGFRKDGIACGDIAKKVVFH